MGETNYPIQRTCWIPARCFNLVYHARSRADGYLQLGLPGLSDNLVSLTASHWRCWNRRLNAQLISLSDFKNGKRAGLHDPVECTLTLHHTYSRTIVHRIFDSLTTATERRLRQTPIETPASLLFLEVEKGRSSVETRPHKHK